MIIISYIRLQINDKRTDYAHPAALEDTIDRGLFHFLFPRNAVLNTDPDAETFRSDARMTAIMQLFSRFRRKIPIFFANLRCFA